MFIQTDTIRHKAIALANAAIEQFGMNDEALDTYGRNAEIDSYGDVTWCAPAWLSYYSSTGRGTDWQDKLIERCEESQADEWARQYPNRKGLLQCAYDGDSRYESEAQEWLDAALGDEAIYLSFEIRMTDSDVIITSGFGDDINAPLAQQFKRTIGRDEFLLMPDDELSALINEIETVVYTGKDAA